MEEEKLDYLRSSITMYISREQTGLKNLKTINIKRRKVMKTALQKDLPWFLLRQIDTGVIQDVIGYLPAINEPATNMSTVYEILNQSDNIRNSLQTFGANCISSSHQGSQ